MSECNNQVISCFLINARSIVAKLDEFHKFLNDKKPHVVFITESWLHNNVQDAILCDTASYHVHRCDRNDERHGGGVLVLVSSQLHCVRVEIPARFCTLELLFIDLIDASRNSRVRTICCYRPPDFNEPGNFARSELLSSAISHLSTSCEYATVCVGDFNLPNFTWTTFTCPDNAAYSNFRTMCLENGLDQLVDQPTLLSNNHILDLLLVNDPLLCCNLCVCTPPINSDHNLVSFSLNFSPSTSPLATKQPNFPKADFDAIQLFLWRVDWNLHFTQCMFNVEK